VTDVTDDATTKRTTKADILALAEQFKRVMVGIRPESQRFTATTGVDRWNASAESISQFAYLVASLAEQTFGVDGDGDCQVRVRVEDRKRHEAFHYRPVPRVAMEERSFERLFGALRVAQTNLAIANKDMELFLRLLDDGARNMVSTLRMRAQAMGCQKCQGKGYVVDRRPYAEKTQDRLNNGAYYKPSHTMFCECQKPDRHWLGHFDPLDDTSDGEETIDDE